MVDNNDNDAEISPPADAPAETDEADDPYANPRSDEVQRRNLITGLLLVLFIIAIVTISVIARL